MNSLGFPDRWCIYEIVRRVKVCLGTGKMRSLTEMKKNVANAIFFSTKIRTQS